MAATSQLATLAPRAGFALLLLTLGGVAWVSLRDADAGLAAVGAERARLEAVSAAALREELLAALDVAEARVEALETLPLLDEAGLVLVRDGVQLAPRVAGQAAPGGALDGVTEAGLLGVLRAGAPAWDAAQRAGQVEASLRGVVPGWPAPLPPETREALLFTLRRGGLPPVAQLAWLAALVQEGAAATPRPDWLGPLAGAGLPREAGRPALDGLQSAVLRAWPWLSRDEAGRWCVETRRRGEALGVKTEAFAAACARGLEGARLEVKGGRAPWLRGEVLAVERPAPPPGVSELRGVRLELAARLEAVTKTRRSAGVLAGDDVLELAGHDGPLAAVTLTLRSPRLDAAEAGQRAALRWKLGFVVATALLGAVVLALASVAQRRREETLAAQREFIATVSHELRTPLASLRLLAETLERRLEGSEAARDYPRRLVQAADGLTFLVDNILSFNRLEAGRWVPVKEPFAFTALEGLLRDEAALAPEGELVVATSGLEGLRPHALDPRLLEVLVRNLARNAWKYAQRRPARFSVEGHDEGEVAVLRFVDDGPGIPEAERERVFEAFHRLAGDAGRAAGGAGLGLALARRVATLHGGTLTIAASSPAGTTFELRLPR